VKRRSGLVIAAAVAAAVAVAVVGALEAVAAIGAGALLQPVRSTRRVPLPAGCVERTFTGADVRLKGWHCTGAAPRLGSLIILHGVADTRASVAGLVGRFTAQRLDVIAYDSRAHGESEGAFCTYGYYEKLDLRRLIASLEPGPVVLMGTSLGAAVALQAAAGDSRVTGVIAAEIFSDLRAIARDRAPRFVPDWIVAKAFRMAEDRAGFNVDEVSPVRAARSIEVPVLLIHGDRDVDTAPDHSRRVLAALRGPKRLILVAGARHNESLRDAVLWAEIDKWVERLLPGKGT
jgi:uncharacterized protein